jgi:hypothetical protein
MLPEPTTDGSKTRNLGFGTPHGRVGVGDLEVVRRLAATEGLVRAEVLCRMISVPTPR